MPVNPVRARRDIQEDDQFDHSVADLLSRLAALPPQTDVPYLSITLDWRIAGDNPGRRPAEEVKRSQPVPEDGGSNRPSLLQLESELNRLVDSYGPRGDVYDALVAARLHVLDWLRNDLEPAALGAYLVVHEPSATFVATGLPLPLETTVTLAGTPRFYKLVRLHEDHPTYAILQADQADAVLSLVTHGTRDRAIVLESTLYPRHNQAGGNQRRYQQRAGVRVDAFAREIMTEVEVALRDDDVQMLVLTGSDLMMRALEAEMSPAMTHKVIGAVRMEPTTTVNEKIERTIELAETAERARETDTVARLQDAIGSGGLGVAGDADTLRKLQHGQVDALIMCDTYAGEGWADYANNLYGVGHIPAEHPTGRGNMVAVDLRDEFVRLALATGASVEIVHSSVPVSNEEPVRRADEPMPMTAASDALVDMGGIGATLRYAVTATTS